MDPSLIKELQLEPLSPRGSDFSYSSEPLCSDSSNSSKPPSDSDRSGRNPQPEAKMAVDQSQRRRPPPLDLHQSSEIQDLEKLKGPQFSGLTDSQEEWKQTPTQPEKRRKKRGFWRWKSCCFKRDDQETDDEHEVKMESAVDKYLIMGKFSSLFRSKSDKDKPDKAPVNPYAQQPPSSDTYSPAPSYGGNREAPSGLPSGPRPGGYGGGLPSGPRPGSSAPPPYSAQNDAAFADNKKRYDSAASSPLIGYGNDRPGAPSGYGSNRYDNAAGYGQNNNAQAPPPRQGGYGGLDNNRAQLYDGYSPQQAPPKDYTLPENYEELTAEEKDEAQARVTKGKIVDTLRDTAASTARSRQKMAEGLERMRDIDEILYRDGQILNKVEQQISESQHQSRLAKANLDNLDAANSSLFNVFANSKGKLAEREMRKEISERERQLEKEELRRQEYKWNNQGIIPDQKRQQLLGKRVVDKSKYIYNDSDEEQETLNERIEDDIASLGQDALLLTKMALAQAAVLDHQVKQTGVIGENVSRAHEDIRSNDHRMKVKNGI